MKFGHTAILQLLQSIISIELRAGGIAQISNLAECSHIDFLAVPEERRHELSSLQRTTGHSAITAVHGS
jgi:hypothetical protein